MRRLTRNLTALVLTTLIFFSFDMRSASAKEVAITIDDFPLVSANQFTLAEQLAMMRKISAALKKHQIKALAFVTCGEVKPEHLPFLEELKRSGHTLGNHSYGHLDLHKNTLKDFQDDILRCDKTLSKWLVSVPKHFRFPLLHYGETPEKKKAIDLFLRANGYKNVPVSIDNDEWAFNLDFIGAIKAKKNNEAKAVGEGLIKHLQSKTEHYQSMARQKLGRDIKHILLIHSNPLTAAYLDKILDWYKNDGWTFITVDEALKDPAYQMPDKFIGDQGTSWLDRIGS